jgi:ethanolamine ammonia-lyase small subunit
MRFFPMDNPADESTLLGGPSNAKPEHWSALSRFTSARIALGRAGGSWRTQTLLGFRLAHARARDAVCKSFDADCVETQLNRAGYETVRLATAADTQAVFLKRPDLGRMLSENARHYLEQNVTTWKGRDLAVIISDGLSAKAAEKQAAPTLASLLPVLTRARWTMCPIFIIPFARVKLQDELGALLQVRHTLALLGERPGLGSPDSLGAYLTYRPRPEKTDADRNCVSNIRPLGLAPGEAGLKIAQLLLQSAAQQTSGIGLKEAISLPKRLE